MELTPEETNQIADISIDHAEYVFGSCTEDNFIEYNRAMNDFTERYIKEKLRSKEERDRLASIVELKEKERSEWAEMCIKKQATIEEMRENLILGNTQEAYRISL